MRMCSEDRPFKDILEAAKRERDRDRESLHILMSISLRDKTQQMAWDASLNYMQLKKKLHEIKVVHTALNTVVQCVHLKWLGL